MGTVTWLQLGAALAAIVGAVSVGFSALMFFASAMASVPDEDLALSACGYALFGLMLIGLSIWGLIG